MKLEVTADLSKLEDRFSDQRLEALQTRFAMQVGNDSNKFCKVASGDTRDTMQANSNFKAGEVSWTTPYAKDAYYDPRVKTVRNKNATSRWFETAKSQRFNSWMELVRRNLASG